MINQYHEFKDIPCDFIDRMLIEKLTVEAISRVTNVPESVLEEYLKLPGKRELMEMKDNRGRLKTKVNK